MDHNRSLSLKSNKLSHKGQMFTEKMVTLLQLSVAIIGNNDLTNIKIWVNKGFDKKRAIIISSSVIGSLLVVIAIFLLICFRDRLRCSCHCKCPEKKYKEVPQSEYYDNSPNKEIINKDTVKGSPMVGVTHTDLSIDAPIPKPGSNLYPVFASVEDARMIKFREKYPAQLYVSEEMPDMKPICEICLCQFIDKSTFITLYCRHTFHYVCIYERVKTYISLSRDLICPSCATKIEI